MWPDWSDQQQQKEEMKYKRWPTLLQQCFAYWRSLLSFPVASLYDLFLRSFCGLFIVFDDLQFGHSIRHNIVWDLVHKDERHSLA